MKTIKRFVVKLKEPAFFIIFTIIIIALLTTTYLVKTIRLKTKEMADAELRMALNHRDSTQAFYLAESGLEHGIGMFREKPAWRETVGLTVSLDPGKYTIICVDNPRGIGVNIISTGQVGETRRTVEAMGVFLEKGHISKYTWREK